MTSINYIEEFQRISSIQQKIIERLFKEAFPSTDLVFGEESSKLNGRMLDIAKAKRDDHPTDFYRSFIQLIPIMNCIQQGIRELKSLRQTSGSEPLVATIKQQFDSCAILYHAAKSAINA